MPEKTPPCAAADNALRTFKWLSAQGGAIYRSGLERELACRHLYVGIERLSSRRLLSAVRNHTMTFLPTHV